jgi:Kef-type K+ transport system membrane component KefB
VENFSITKDIEYLIIFSTVLIFPKMLLKFKVPSGITALIIGCIFGYYDSSIQTDQLFRFLAQIGITSLFVFSGLEVNIEEFKEDKEYLIKYSLKSFTALGLIAFGLMNVLDLSVQNSIILGLGIFTPSAGFIINSLHSFKIGEDQEYWVKSKAISKEVISIIVMFVALQSHDLKVMSFSIIFFVGLFLILPYVFKFYFKFISPYAPNSEVPFLVVISLIAGVISKELGAYYLIGAFIVGLVGSQFKHKIFNDDEETLFTALSSFFNVFLPFYFFYAGVKLTFGGFTAEALQLGSIFLILFIPLRLALNATSIKWMLKDFKKHPYDISLSLMPTLIFGLVIAGILKERNAVSSTIIYGLIFYTLISSLLPTILFSFQKREKDQMNLFKEDNED